MKQEKTSVFRKLSIYGFKLVEGSHNFFALLDFDVTDVRKRLREKRVGGTGGSLFAFVLKAIGKCLEEFPEFNALIDLKKTTCFETVDVNIPIEVEVDGKRNPKQYIIRDINHKTLRQVDEEIFRSKHADTGEQGYVFSKTLQRILNALPGKLVVLLFRIILGNHERVRNLSGTVFVTSVSMFSNVPGYIIPYSGGPKASSFAVGSVAKKPVVKNGEVCIREMLNVTAIFNHDIIDGAPAARFINRLRKYIEVSYDLLLHYAADEEDTCHIRSKRSNERVQ